MESIPAPKYEDLAGLMEHVLLAPHLSETTVAEGCELARRYAVAAVVVRPSDAELAARWTGSTIALGSAVDLHGGDSTTSVKTYAVLDLLRRGAREIDTTINTGKLVSRQFQYLETELLQMADACHQSSAILKVHLESEHLNPELKIVACRIARRAGVDYVAGPLADMPLLKEYLRDRVHRKGSASTLEEALEFRDVGCLRIESAATAAILEAWKTRLAASAAPGPVVY